MEQIPVKVKAFEGPMDLLLHLIDINKIDIYDIPIAEITDQYLKYLDAMDQADMNVTSEFLVMAATLLDIKCRMLLPREKDEQGEEIDPRNELVEKLLEYKMYKYMSFALRDREMDAASAFYRQKRLPEEVRKYQAPIDYQELVGDNSLDTLHAVFEDILRRADDRKDPVRSSFGRIEREEVDMGERASYVRDYLLKNRHTSFRHLLEKSGSRDEIIVTFLVFLEMMKTGDLHVEQEENFADISIDVTNPDHFADLDLGWAVADASGESAEAEADLSSRKTAEQKEAGNGSTGMDTVEV